MLQSGEPTLQKRPRSFSLFPIRIGMSGWTYAPWRGVFYPDKLRQKDELSYAAKQVTSIEINGTFYRMQTPKSFQQWYAQVPDDFQFAVKAPQYMTHRRRMKDVAQPLRNFFASGVLALGKKLGPILWQLPPNLPLVDDRFEQFMRELPHDSLVASALAMEHDSFIKSPLVEAPGKFPIRHAFEFRHSSFHDSDFFAVMRQNNVALVFADSGEHSLNVEELTADHVYLRMHGQGEVLQNGYPDAYLKMTAKKVLAWAKDRPVNVYFDNDAKGHAPLNAMRMLEILANKA